MLRGSVSPAVFTEREVGGRTYHRLNHDYEGLHALARFFITHSGPSQRAGGEGMIPFLIDMAQLFESFVAAWLGEHLPPAQHVEAQESGAYDPEGEIGYRIDLVLYDEAGRPQAVLDTKYKLHTVPAADDVAQVVTYATRKRCQQALLVYPHYAGEWKDFLVGGVRVRTAGFPLDRDLDEAGHKLLSSLPVPLAFSAAMTTP